MRPGLQAALSGLIQFLSQMDLVASCLGPSFDFAEITLGPNGPRVISGRNHIGVLDSNRYITYISLQLMRVYNVRNYYIVTTFLGYFVGGDGKVCFDLQSERICHNTFV